MTLHGPVYKQSDYAGFWRRTAALLVDALLLLAVFYAASWGWYYLAPDAWITRDAYVRLNIGWYLLAAAYVLGFRFLQNGTPGYRLLGIRYAYALDGRPPWWAVALRSVAAVSLMWLFALDHFWILFDKRHLPPMCDSRYKPRTRDSQPSAAVPHPGMRIEFAVPRGYDPPRFSKGIRTGGSEMADSALTMREIEGGTVVGFPPDTNLDANTVEVVRDDVVAVVERGAGSIVLDFTNVTFASSPAIGLLVTLRLKAARTDHRLLLAGLHENIAGVLHVMQMDKIFELFPSVDAAAQSLRTA